MDPSQVEVFLPKLEYGNRKDRVVMPSGVRLSELTHEIVTRAWENLYPPRERPPSYFYGTGYAGDGGRSNAAGTEDSDAVEPGGTSFQQQAQRARKGATKHLHLGPVEPPVTSGDLASCLGRTFVDLRNEVRDTIGKKASKASTKVEHAVDVATHARENNAKAVPTVARKMHVNKKGEVSMTKMSAELHLGQVGEVNGLHRMIKKKRKKMEQKEMLERKISLLFVLASS